MRDLVRERVADHREVGVGLQRAEDVVDDLEAVRPLEVAALLNVGVLVDDAGLLGGEVGRGPREQVVGDFLLELVLACAGCRKAVQHGVPHVASARERGK